MGERSYRNSFTSGVLDPLLAARSDVPQYRTGLRTGTNIMLLPHGGFMRRPGCRFCRDLTGLGDPEYQGRTTKFRFNEEQQYLLHWRDERVDVYEGTASGRIADANRITRIRSPYNNAKVADIWMPRRAQTADTLVICHQQVAPYRLLRSALRATDPIATTNLSTTVRVYHPDHKLITGDEIGLSGLTATGGVSADTLNSFHAVTVPITTFAGNSIATTSTSTTVTVTLPSGHGFQIGERITLAGLVAIGGLPADQLNRTHTITAAAATTVDFVVPLQATSTTTGGTGGTWQAASFYTITVGGAATSTAAGGGTSGRAWVLHSLAPNANRRVALTHLPQFDYEDASSPSPKPERQRIIFEGFITGDSYKLTYSFPVAGGGAIVGQTTMFDWTGEDIAENGRRIEAELDTLTQVSFVSVTITYDSAVSGGGGGSDPDHHEFVLEFDPAISIDLIGVFKVRTENGQIFIERDVSGGSTEEDVISTTRGWPRGCVFYQRRLWLFGLSSRPVTLLASKIEDFFNFDVGSATDSDAIDATGDFDPILDLIAERGLFALTAGSEIEISGGGENAAITPGNIGLRVMSRYGTFGIPAVSVAGRPIYIDRTGRTVRQLGFSQDSGAAESKDISILSQFLFDDPVAMDVWRNSYGDYCAIVMDDGSMAVLNINVDQGVAGWTKWTTDGEFLDVCESGDVLYAIVSRTIGETTQYFLEAFDFEMHTDAATLTQDPLQTVWDDNDHLEGETVQVRLSNVTCSDQVVASGDVTSMNGDVVMTGNECEVGLAIPLPTAEPMPPVTQGFFRITGGTVDLYGESRAVYVDGYRLKDLEPGGVPSDANGTIPGITGERRFQKRGWASGAASTDAARTVRLEFREPQPATVRAITLEVTK